jgi:hypothetical protein
MEKKTPRVSKKEKEAWELKVKNFTPIEMAEHLEILELIKQNEIDVKNGKFDC